MLSVMCIVNDLFGPQHCREHASDSVKINLDSLISTHTAKLNYNSEFQGTIERTSL